MSWGFEVGRVYMHSGYDARLDHGLCKIAFRTLISVLSCENHAKCSAAGNPS
jgi:hypothetical protein